MPELKNLQTVAGQSLAGLEADERLRQRILHAAREGAPAHPVRRKRIAAVAAAAVVLAVAAGVLLIPGLNRSPMPAIENIAAGGGESVNATALPERSTDHTLSISASSGRSDGSLWLPGKDGNMPLICLDGRVYRMLSEPDEVPKTLLSDTEWQIDTYTTEPSLAAMKGTLSNVALTGASAWGIKGMENTLAAAEIDGAVRLFQRVSYNGTALLGRETLSDTLQIKGHIREMTLSGVGTVSDTSACEKLFGILLDNAVYDGPAALSDKKTLRIELDNGLSLQLACSKEKLSACGIWSCPEFTDAFADAAE